LLGGFSQYAYVENNPPNLVDPSGQSPFGIPSTIIPLIFRHGPKAESSLPCSGTGNVEVCCLGDKCNFKMSTVYVPLPAWGRTTGVLIFWLAIRHDPPISDATQLPPEERRPFLTFCQSDVGRVNNATDHLTVTLLDGTPCIFTPEHFDERGNLIEPLVDLPAACNGVLDSATSIELARPPTSDGQTFFTKRPARSVKFEFTIETFCGCGGTDNLGRPRERMTGSLKLKGGVP